METSKTQTSLRVGYHQCKVARRGRVCKEVFDISVERVGTKFSVNPDHLSSFDQQFDNAIENCFIGTHNNPSCKQNISCTFDPRDLSCVVCPDSHSALVSREGGKTPITLVLSDQSFPPIIEGGEGENCVRILRVEDGSLGEIVDLALEMFPNLPILVESFAMWVRYAAGLPTFSNQMHGGWRRSGILHSLS